MKHQGWSLIELIIVLSIMAILFHTAYPSFQTYFQRSHRLEGQTALFDLANRMEAYYTQHGSYQFSSIGNGRPTDVLDKALTHHDWYELSIIEADDQHFIIEAMPKTNDDCGALRLTDQGTQSISAGPAGRTPTGKSVACWS